MDKNYINNVGAELNKLANEATYNDSYECFLKNFDLLFKNVIYKILVAAANNGEKYESISLLDIENKKVRGVPRGFSFYNAQYLDRIQKEYFADSPICMEVEFIKNDLSTHIDLNFSW